MSPQRAVTRRDFLLAGGTVTGGGLMAACRGALVPPRSPASAVRTRIRAVCFDVFTLFDPRSVERAAHAVIGEQASALCKSWRTRQFEYSWLRTSARQYADFQAVTTEALEFAARETGLTLSDDQRRQLIDAYTELEPWPDTRAALDEWHRAGLVLAPLSNYSPSMLERLVGGAGLGEVFTALISTDRARTFKPDPSAYALGPAVLGLPKESVAFAAFGGWDAAGARWFGFPTFWLNRLGVTEESLAPGPQASGRTLSELAAFVAR